MIANAAFLPGFIQQIIDLFSSSHVLGIIGVVSVVMFVATAVGVPWFLARLPADYFSRKERHSLGMLNPPRNLLKISLAVLKNLLGGLLVLVGILMLVLPGQGLLTILVGLLLADFPGKKRLERKILANPSVFRAINALRQKLGRPPFERGSFG